MVLLTADVIALSARAGQLHATHAAGSLPLYSLQQQLCAGTQAGATRAVALSYTTTSMAWSAAVTALPSPLMAHTV
jgi:hypothetical protein